MDYVEKIIQQMIELNDQKYHLLESLIEQTERQSVALATNSLNSLMDHIHEKQAIINQIDQIDRQFYDGFTEMKEALRISSMEEIDTKAYPQVFELKLSVSMIMQKLMQVENLDQKNHQVAQSELENLRQDLKEANTMSRAARGYNSKELYTDASAGFFIDSRK